MSVPTATGKFASSFKERLTPSAATRQNLATTAKALLVALASIALTATVLGGLVQGRILTPAMLPKMGTYAVIGGATTLGLVLGGSLIKLFVDRRATKEENLVARGN